MSESSLSVEEQWHAVFVATGKEEEVKADLQDNFGEKIYFAVPKRKIRERNGGSWNDVVRPLYPGYIILYGNLGLEDIHTINRTKGVYRILADDAGLQVIDEEEIDVLIGLIDEDGMIGYSTAIVENDEVVILDGPLATIKGLVESVDIRKGRAKVSLTFLGRKQSVYFGLNILKPEK